MKRVNQHVRSCQFFALVGLCLASTNVSAQTPLAAQVARDRLVQNVLVPAGIKNERVLQSINKTPRHEFVPVASRQNAYYDMALPIGAKQTISSPFIVAYMTETLETQPEDKVLEIGTGSGYQAAILSPLVAEVYTIEIVESLGRRARSVLKRLGYRNVFTKIGDGFEGWEEHAPFDKIIVTCSPESVPKPLVEQLKEGGLMVIPVGERYQQTLYLFRKKGGKLEKESLRPTLFVPMTGEAENNREVKPNPKEPKAVNGSFELPLRDDKFIPGWYYQRQAKLAKDKPPSGKQYIQFENETPGRSSNVLQGFPIDGSSVARIRLAAWVRCRGVVVPNESMSPSLAVSFYDDSRRPLGIHWLGPWKGSFDWVKFEETFRVPPNAREGILRAGLFGATGELSIDDVRLEVVNP